MRVPCAGHARQCVCAALRQFCCSGCAGLPLLLSSLLFFSLSSSFFCLLCILLLYCYYLVIFLNASTSFLQPSSIIPVSLQYHMLFLFLHQHRTPMTSAKPKRIGWGALLNSVKEKKQKAEEEGNGKEVRHKKTKNSPNEVCPSFLVLSSRSYSLPPLASCPLFLPSSYVCCS